jgi:DNA-binding transcriptional LysR family regulator
MDWDKLRTFHIVAEAGSFTHAGAALDLSQSAVSRQISGLEESLGVKLFHRHARGLVLTEAGELLEKTASDIFGKLSMVEARLSDSISQPTGTLRITAPNFLGSTWVVPRLAELHEKYPELEIQLLMDNRIFNLSMREADVAIRLYKPDNNDLLYKSLGKIHFKVCGSASYFKKYGVPKTIKELKEHTLIGYPPHVPVPFEDPNWLFRKAGIDEGSNTKLVRMNSLHAISQGVVNGLGLAVLPEYLISQNKDIKVCLEDTTRPPVEMYFVYAEERKNSNRINLLQKFLLESAKNTDF